MNFSLQPWCVATVATRRGSGLVACVLLAVTAIGCERSAVVVAAEPAKPAAIIAANAVASYFTGAEIQAETDAQRAEVQRALVDILTLGVDELKAKRYADYAGAKDKRTVLEIVADHVVPATPKRLDASAFFADVKSAQAQAAVRDKLDSLDASRAVKRP